VRLFNCVMEAGRGDVLQREQWRAMLEKTNDLVSGLPVLADGIPQLHRDPAQLERATRALRAGMAGPGAATTNLFMEDAEEDDSDAKKKDAGRGQRLLGQYNFDSEKLERELHAIVPRGLAHGHPEEGYDHQSQVITTSIMEALATAKSQSEHRSFALMEDEWEAEKAQLLEELKKSDSERFAPIASKEVMVMDLTPQETPFVGENESYRIAAPYRGFDMTRVNNYLKALKESGAESQPENLSRRFLELARNEFKSDELPSCVELWTLVTHMLSSGTDSESGAKAFLEEQYRINKMRFPVEKSSWDGVLNWLKSPSAENVSFGGGGGLRTVLQKYTFREESEEPPSQNLNRRFEGIKHQESAEETIDGSPLWAVIYYCIRCGGLKDVVSNVRQKNLCKGPLEALMVDLLEQLLRGEGISDENVETLRSEIEDPGVREKNHAQRFSPWKRAILYILLRGQDSSLLDRIVNSSIQDYMWIKLSIILSVKQGKRMEFLMGLQKILQKKGPAHFENGNDPHLYGRLLLMAQLPERAVVYLANRASFSDQKTTSVADAVHLAIALLDAGLIKNELKEIARITAEYVQARFAKTKPQDAIFYMHRIFRNDHSQRMLAADGIAKVLLEHSSNADDGLRLLQRSDSTLKEEVLVRTGELAERQGRLKEAVIFFAESEHGRSHAIAITNKQLVRCIRTSNISNKDWLVIARSMRDRFRSDDSQYETYEILLKLVEFRILYTDKKYEAALNVVSGVFPLTRVDVEKCSEDFRKLDNAVLEVIMHVFSLAISALQEVTYRSPNRAACIEQFNAFENFFNEVNHKESAAQIAQQLARFDR